MVVVVEEDHAKRRRGSYYGAANHVPFWEKQNSKGTLEAREVDAHVHET